MKFSDYPVPSLMTEPANVAQMAKPAQAPVSLTPVSVPSLTPPKASSAICAILAMKAAVDGDEGLASPVPVPDAVAAVTETGKKKATGKPKAKAKAKAKPAPVAKTPASAILQQFGYRVTYVQEVETAQQALADLLNRSLPILGLDIETMPKAAYREDPLAGLDPYRGDIRLVQVTTPEQEVLVFDLLTLPPALLQHLMARPLIAHNALFEWRFLTQAGLTPMDLHDSLLLCRIATGETRNLSLADCAKRCWSFELDKTLQVSDWSAPTLSPEQLDYAALDAVLAHQLGGYYWPVIGNTGQQAAYARFRQALPVIGQQMLDGVPLNVAALQAMTEDWQGQLDPLQAQLRAEMKLNPDSAVQVVKWLEQHLHPTQLVSWPRTDKGQLKTDAETLSTVTTDHPLLQSLLEYKGLRKNLSTYGKGYLDKVNPVTGRLHPQYRIAGAASGRFSCSQPNLQNPPRDPVFRALFAPAPGYQLVVADYSQIELRIAALLAPDAVMLNAYQVGADIHKLTAAAISGKSLDQVTKQDRQMAKAVNFGLIYGMGATTLAQYASTSYGVSMTLSDAQAARTTFFTTYPGIARWHSVTQARLYRDTVVSTQGGLRRDLRHGGRDARLTEALNTPDQGSGAECLIEALNALPSALRGLDARLVLHVHDEIVLEVAAADVDRAKVALVKAMEYGFNVLFPNAAMPGLVEAHAGPNWHDAKGG